MKKSIKKLFSNRTNQIIIGIYILLELLMWYTGFDILWFIVLTLMLVLGLILEILYGFPLKKSMLIQFGIIISFIVLAIIYAVVRDVVSPDKSYQYGGGVAPNGDYCDYGYKKATDTCCHDDDYSCEKCDLYGIYCDAENVIQGFEDISHITDLSPDGDYDCSDFSSWEESQKVFIREGGPKIDHYNLDEDQDGVACESLIE